MFLQIELLQPFPPVTVSPVLAKLHQLNCAQVCQAYPLIDKIKLP